MENTQTTGADTFIVNYPYVLTGKNPKKFCINKGNDIIAAYMQTARKWEYESMMNLYNMSSRGGSFLEVGANIGTDTVLASDFFKQCYAFEPLSLHVDLLKKNIELNGVTNIEIFPVAVSDVPGTTKVYIGQGHNSGSSALAPNHPGMDRFEEVSVVTLDAAMPPAVRDVTFMHIDTEGHDIKVLKGAREFIHRQVQKPVIRIEFQPRTLALHGSNIAELIGFLDEFKYRPMYNANNNVVPFSYSVLIELFYLWKGSDGWIDVLLIP